MLKKFFLIISSYSSFFLSPDSLPRSILKLTFVLIYFGFAFNTLFRDLIISGISILLHLRFISLAPDHVI